MQEIPGSPSPHPAERMLMSEDDEQLSVSFPHRGASPHSDWDSLFSSPSHPSPEHHSPDATSRVGPQSAESPSTSHPLPHSTSRSLSISTDHYSQFSSPRRRPTTPPRTSQHSHHQPNSGSRKLHAAASSPLTPVSSPVLRAQTHSQSPDPLQFLSPQRHQAPFFLASRPNPPLAIPPRVHSPPVEIPEDPQPLNRYSLRRREARQLNPYAYDKLLYKQQLKSHPDAIVKFRSRSGGGEDGTQDEFVFPLDNPDEDGDYVDVEGESSRRRKRRVQSLDRHNGLGEDGQELEARQMDEGWLPEALKELSSSDEDDNEIRKLARRVRREREKAEALARAEARKAAAEARRTEIETKKATNRRPKAFPVQGDAEHVSTHLPERPPLVSLLIQYFVVSLKSGCRTETVTFPIPLLAGALGARDGFIPPVPPKITIQTPRAVSGIFPLPDFGISPFT